MKTTMIRTTALCLALVLSLGAFLALGASSGVFDATAAASSEMWMLEGNGTALLRGRKTPISEEHPTASPYAYLGNTWTCYIPLSAPCLYSGASWSLGEDEKTVTVTLSGGAKAQLTVGEVKWMNGTLEEEFLLPPVLKDGEVYLSSMSVQALFSLKVFFNVDIGLVVLSSSSMPYSRNYSSLKTQIETLRSLLFDTVTGDGIYSDVAAHVGINTHPRLVVDQARFDELRENYLYYSDPDHLEEAAENKLYTLVSRFVAQAESSFKSYFIEETDDLGNVSYLWRSEQVLENTRQPYYLYDENGKRLVGKTSYTDSEGNTTTLSELYGKSPLYGDGYDEGGRSNVAAYTTHLQYFGYAWQITRDDKYVYAFYQLARQLGMWEHWGEGHFLNCADGAALYALGLDWIWHAYDNDPIKRDELVKILFDKAVNVAYYAISDPTGGKRDGILHRSTTMGENWRLTEYTNNWNTVCCSGITMAALAILDYDRYAYEAKYVMEKQIGAIYKCLIQYAPDGAYVESPGYWAYGTNTYMRMLACLESATGKTYGYLDTVGLRQSYYFANNICDNDFYVWNYHDGGRGRIDGTTFYMAAYLYGDPNIAHFRDLFLDRYPTGSSIFDPLLYSPALSEGAEPEAVLDANFKGIDTVTMRGSWEKGDTFCGLHVGPNNVSHGDVDCGTFYLEMGGVLWFGDPGAENYNVAPYNRYFNGRYRYTFYRKTLEAHNTILIRSSALSQYGQVFNGKSSTYAKIDTFETNADGAYAISDMKAQYGATCSSASRGLLFTNSRSTVIVQDEIAFSSPTSLTWMAATQGGSVSISEDGRTALITTYVTGKKLILRASLLSEDKNLKFEMKQTGNILPGTVSATTNNTNASGGLIYPLVSAIQPRLIINADNVTSFNVAVVFEMVRTDGSRMPTVGYEYKEMAKWETTSDEWLVEANKDIVYPEQIHYDYQPSDLVFILRDIERAGGDIGKLTEIIRRHPAVDASIKLDDHFVSENIGTYRYWRNYVNGYLRDLNKTFGAIFEDSLYELT